MPQSPLLDKPSAPAAGTTAQQQQQQQQHAQRGSSSSSGGSGLRRHVAELEAKVLELLLDRKAADARHVREVSARDAELTRLQDYIDQELSELQQRQAQVEAAAPNFRQQLQEARAELHSNMVVSAETYAQLKRVRLVQLGPQHAPSVCIHTYYCSRLQLHGNKTLTLPAMRAQTGGVTHVPLPTRPPAWLLQVPTDRLTLPDAVRIAVHEALQVCWDRAGWLVGWLASTACIQSALFSSAGETAACSRSPTLRWCRVAGCLVPEPRLMGAMHVCCGVVWCHAGACV